MKKFLSVFLALAMIFSLCVPTFAAGVEDQVLKYSLDVGGEHEITVANGDIITVNYVITNTSTEDSAEIRTTQDQIKYDHNFFDLVEGSNKVCDDSGKDAAGNPIKTLEDATLDYDLTADVTTSTPIESDEASTHYILFNSTAITIYSEEKQVIGTFRLKVKDTVTGSSVVENTTFFATDQANSDKFGSAKQDLTVTIGGTTGGGDEKQKETTPSATFTATGNSTGTLSDVAAGMKYSTDNGTTWTDITTTSLDLTGLSAGTIKVVKKGNGTTTIDSDAQTITVTKGTKPSAGKTDCTTSANNDGTITGVTSDMEYMKSGASGWTAIGGTTVPGLANGTYYVRVKANGTALASEQQTVTISEYTPGALGGSVSITGTATYGETLTADVTGITNNTGTLSYQWKRGGSPIDGATGSTYTTVAADIGKEITVTVTSSVETGSKTSFAVTVGKKELTITDVKATNRKYIKDNKIVVLTDGSLVGKVGEDQVSFTLGNGTITSADVGNNKTVTTAITLTGADKDNYTLKQPTDVKVSITKATPEYKAPTNLTATYGQTLADVDIASGNGTGDGKWSWMTNTESVGDASDTAKKFKAKFTPTDPDNYETCTDIEVEVTVGKKELTITGVTATERAYNKSKTVALVGTSAQLQGVVDGDVVTIDMTPAEGTVADAGAGKDKIVTVTGIALDGADKDNYTLTQPTDVKVTINQKALTITGVQATERKYEKDNTSVELTGGSLVGVETDDTVNFNLGKGSIESADVGNDKSVDTSITLTGADAANYTLTKPTGITVNITKADQKPNITSTKTLYVGGTAFDLNTLVSGTVGAVTFEKTSGDAATLTGSSLTPDSVKTGEVKITVNAAGNENYKPYTGTNAITVTVTDKGDAGVTIEAPETKTYGEGTFQVSASATTAGTGTQTWNWVSSDPTVLKILSGENTATPTIQILKADTTGVTLTASYSSDTHEGSNSATIVVNKASQTITADATQTFTYGDTNKSVSATITKGDGTLSYDVQNGTSVSVDASTGALTINGIGDTTIKVTASETDNYNSAEKTITVKVAPAEITEATAQSQPYTGSTLNPVLTVKAGSLDATYDIGTWSGNLKDIGTYTVTVTGNGNFTGSKTVTFEITHEHGNGELQEGVPAEEFKAGYRGYYKCSCGEYFEEEDCTTPIKDLEAWKTEGGRGYLKPTHEHGNGELQEGVPAEEFEAGYRDYYKCSCDEYFEDEDCTTPIKDLEAWKTEGGRGYLKPTHEHGNGELQEGVPATETEAGYKEYYVCACGGIFEDEACTVLIEDLDAWKAEGGNGYIPPLKVEHDISYKGDEHVIFAKDLTESAGEGETVTFTFTIRPRYIVDTVTVKTANGDKVKVRSYNGVYSFVMPDEDVIVKVTSERKIISSEIVIKDDSNTNKGETNPETGAPVEAAPFAALAAVIAAGACFACRKNKETK